MKPARGTFDSTLPPLAWQNALARRAPLRDATRTTYGYCLAHLRLNVVGDVLLNEELDGHTMFVLENGLHASKEFIINMSTHLQNKARNTMLNTGAASTV